ncbi:uncharacterized protein [Spinacia oleracea]|uniref:DUF674 family protein n=1 Tax=Spinacia oleracea TaxID=3562 RepID=A0A9R0II79_SPIOL|nr:uncharacterized protein LOC110789439 [Spinacia oleracea]
MAKMKISLKLQVDVKTNKVVFAEAGKDFVDFIFTLMELPLSTVSKLLNNEKLGMVGCLGELYKSIESLDVDYYDSKLSKDSLLKQTDDVTVPLFSLNTVPKPSSETLITYYECSNHSM